MDSEKSNKKAAPLLLLVFLLTPMCLTVGARANADDSVNSELTAAIKLRDLPVVLRMLAAGADTNWKGEHGATPLHWTAASGGREVAQALIDHGADVNGSDDMSLTPLHVAASWGSADVADVLVLRGAKVDATNSNGDTPLHVAVSRLMVTRSSAPRPTAQDVAATISIVKLLVAHSADINAQTRTNATPLHLAVLSGQLEVVDVLLAKGANARAVNQQGVGSLYVAARIGRPDIGADLIAHGSDPNAPAQGGITPLSWAAQHGDADFVAMLLAHGANVNVKDSLGKAPLFWAIRSNLYFAAINADSASPLAWLSVSMRAQNPELRSNEGWTNLTRELQSSKQKWHDVATALLEHGANMGHDADSDAELFDAIYLDDVGLVTAMVDHGANVNTTRFEESALQAAIGEQRADIAVFLMEKGANVNARNLNDRTPLHLAAKKIRDTKFIETLLEHGAKINALDSFGETPLAAAERVRNDEVAAVLRQHGGSGGASDKSPHSGSPSTPVRTLQQPDCGERFYPTEAVGARTGGSTIVRVCIGANDRIDLPITVVTSSGNPSVDVSATTCSAAGRYEAGTVNGTPVSSCKDYKITFQP